MTKRPTAVSGIQDLNLLAADGIPQAFTWQGRRYLVQTVLMQWVEAGPWWRSLRELAVLADVDDLEVSWRLWRVEAQSSAGMLVCDLAQRVCLTSTSAYPWRLIRVFD